LTVFTVSGSVHPSSIPVVSKFSAPVLTGCGTHPASYTMGTGSFPGVKRQRRGSDHPPQFSAEVKERVELYIYSVSGPYHCLLKPYIQERQRICISLFVLGAKVVGQGLLLQEVVKRVYTLHNLHSSVSTHSGHQPAATWVNTTRYCK